MKILDAIAQAVPTARWVFWMLAGAAAMFGMGFTVAFGVGDSAENIRSIPLIAADVEVNSNRINGVVTRLDNADRDRTRILCLVRLTVQGETLLAVEIDERCP